LTTIQNNAFRSSCFYTQVSEKFWNLDHRSHELQGGCAGLKAVAPTGCGITRNTWKDGKNESPYVSFFLIFRIFRVEKVHLKSYFIYLQFLSRSQDKADDKKRGCYAI